MSPRLVHLITTDMGLDWLLRPQLEAFADAGFEVIGVSAPGPHVEVIEASGIRHVAIPSLTRAVAPLNDIRALRDLHRAFRGLAPDVVHTHDSKPGLLGGIAARSARVPVVINTVHGLHALPDDRLARRAVSYSLERLVSMFSDAELLQNPEDLPVLRRLGVPHAKLSVVGDGIDLRRFDPAAVPRGTRERLRAQLGIADSTVVIGVVGGLVPERGYETIFAAARKMSDDDCCFVVVGPERPGGAEADGVRFLGPRDDMVGVYSAFDVYASASHRGGFPRSAMEASAMGLPVVATNIRGCRQDVRDGVTGRLFDVDDGDGLAASLRPLVVDEVRRRRMGDAAREYAIAHFDDRNVVTATLRTYEWLLDRVGSAAFAAA